MKVSLVRAGWVRPTHRVIPGAPADRGGHEVVSGGVHHIVRTVCALAMHGSRGQSAGPRDSGLGACHQKDAEETGSDAAIRVRVNSLHTTGIAHSKHGIGIRDLTQTHPISIRNPGGSKHKLSQPGKRSAPRK